MMLQIPVEGGHRGGDLSVTHEQEEMKIERSQHSDKRFYLSASFIVDSPHAISPVREGWTKEEELSLPHLLFDLEKTPCCRPSRHELANVHLVIEDSKGDFNPYCLAR